MTSRMKAISEQCQFARVGADVFGIIGPASILTPEILNSLFYRPFSAGEQHLPINACFGLCAKEDAGGRGVKVLNQINIALNLAKKSNQEHLVYYKQEMEEQTLWRLGMIRQLRTDFANNRLE